MTVVSGQETKFEGTTNIEELLNAMPQVAPTQGTFLSNGATGTATVDLRSLGPPRTLVLVNGRRLGPGDPTTPVPDLDIIPPTLVKRVELLTGGASSVYGSDAVAGVVNFILDTRLDGVRIDAQHSVFQHDNHTFSAMIDALEQRGFPFPRGNTVDGGRSSFDVALGKTLLGGRAHVSVYGGYRKQQGLAQDARDYSACSTQVRRSQNTLLFCGGSFASDPANFVDLFDDVYHAGPDHMFIPGQSFFNFAPYNYYQRPDERYTAGGFADVEVSDAFRPYLEAMFLHDRSVAQLAPGGDFGDTSTINCDSALLSPQQLGLVCFNGNYVGQEGSFPDDNGNIVVVGAPTPLIDPVTGHTYFQAHLEIQRRNVEGGPRQQDLRHETSRLLAGAKGDVAKGVSYDASLMQTKASMTSDDTGFFSSVRLRRAIDVVADPTTGQSVCRSVLTGEDPACVPWDIFTLDGVTPEALTYLGVDAHRHGSTKEQVANVNSTINFGDFGLRLPWSTEGPQLNVGAEYRKDHLNYVPDPLQFTGALAGSGDAQLPASGSTEVKELFAETRIPIVEEGFVWGLALEAGYRQSWYSNAESKVSTNAWKLAADFSPVRGVRLRGSLQRAVRAPNIIELFTPVVQGGFGDDPCAGPEPEATLAECAPTGVTEAQYGHIAKLPTDVFQGYNSKIGGNPELQPETSTTKTIGVVLEPRFLLGLSATVDWWDINLDGAISPIGADLIMATCIATADPFFCTRIHRDSTGSLWLTPQGFVDDRAVNIGAFKVRGVDVGLNYYRRLGKLGSINANMVGSYTSKWIIDPGGLAEAFDCAGLYGVDCSIPTPRWRHKARLTWTSRNGISVSSDWRYTASMKLAPIPIPGYVPGPFSRKLKAESFFDLSAVAQVGKGYEFRLGVNNIFDSEPPIIAAQGEGACGGGCNGNTYPQWYDPLGRYIFAGFSIYFDPF